MAFDEGRRDSQVIHSYGLDSTGPEAEERVLPVIEGHLGNIDSSLGNAAEHDAGVLPQHPLGGEHLGLILGPGSCRSQNRLENI